MSNSYYKILGVNDDASEDDIKRAYKKLAMQYHPDKNKDEGAEEQFKKIAEAYQILSNSDTRRRYDLGERGNFNEPHGPEINPFDIFQRMFNINGSTIHISGLNGARIHLGGGMSAGCTFSSTQTSVQIVNGKKIETIIETQNGNVQKRVIVTDLQSGERFIQN